MNLSITKEELLQLKLNLFKLVKNKNASVLAKNWENAAKCRDEEKLVSQKLQTIKNEILHELVHLKQPLENMDYYVLLQGLLFEFHSVEFYDDCMCEKTIDTIDSHVNKYWNIRNQMHQELMDFLKEEYVILREQMLLSIKEGDQEKGQMVLKRLKAISDLIISNNKHLHH